MKDRWWLLLVGVGVLLIFVVLRAPAAKLVPRLLPASVPVQLSGISGTVWSGQALQLVVEQVTLERVRWRFRPLVLFLGRVEVGLTAQLNEHPVSARAGKGWFSEPYLAAVRGTLPATELLSLAGMNVAQLGGQVEFDLARVEGLQRTFPTVSGSARWAPARVVAPLVLDLGAVQLETRTEAGETRGELNASGGALSFEGEVDLSPDGRYSLQGEVRKQAAVPAAVDDFLATFAEARDGGYRVEWSDQIRF